MMSHVLQHILKAFPQTVKDVDKCLCGTFGDFAVSIHTYENKKCEENT